jgi:phage baseplate assembly protein W
MTCVLQSLVLVPLVSPLRIHLMRKGYQNITVFEKRTRVGGKVHSVVDGENVYEVGAFWAGAEYPID